MRDSELPHFRPFTELVGGGPYRWARNMLLGPAMRCPAVLEIMLFGAGTR